jgi:type I restriction enzyme S subunit
MNVAVESLINLGPHPQYPKSVKAGIPKLALPKPGWRTVPIGDLFNVVTRPVNMQDETVYKLVTVKRSRDGVVEREKLPGKSISVKSQFYVESGDFLISKRQIVHGACSFVPEELSGSIVSNEYTVLHCRDTIIPEFLNCLIHTPYFQQTCFHSSIGVHVEKMIFKLENWFNWKVNIPPIKEQLKIATFVSSIDRKINMVVDKKEKLETYKRGLMQKLFSQEIRFKKNDGSNFPSWKILSADQMFRNVSNKIHNGDLPILSATQEKGVIRRDENGIDIKSSVDSVNSYKIIEPGDFVISLRSFQGGIEYSSILGISSPAYTVLKPNLEIIDAFYKYYFKKESFIRQLSGTVIGIRDGKQISYDAFSMLKIPYPSVAEQKVIANCLEALVNKIEAVSQKIATLETFKKGLLRKVFV